MSNERTRRIKRAIRRADVKGDRRNVAVSLAVTPLFTAEAEEDAVESDFGTFSASPDEVHNFLAQQDQGMQRTTLGQILGYKLG
ncbi:MAG: hypothetical protein WBK55_02670 [Alphaproteobacteria bacterium]